MALLLEELAEMWRRGGTVRLIIGFHESSEFTPALSGEVKTERAVVKAVAKALAGASGELHSLLERDHRSLIPTIREFIVKKALHVRLVTPKSNVDFLEEKGRWPNPEIGIFHSKFAVVHHRDATRSGNLRSQWRYYRSARERRQAGERFSVVTGSFNESTGGYGNNVEDAVLHRSWVEGEGEVTDHFVDRFESMWVDAAEDVRTMPFDDEFTTVLKRVVRRPPADWFNWRDFSDVIRRSPGYTGLALPRMGLLSHQIRTYREGLSRWPIRLLLADEVGLGKTIEAGSMIHYMLTQGLVRKVAILTPASLRYQWQRELANLFDLSFWVYNSGTGMCELGDECLEVGTSPFSGPNNVIVSWHWARLGATKESCRFRDNEMPDLLVVDEAHHARRHETAPGHYTRTQLHMLLDHLARRTLHVILMTATPFQTSQLDYYSILELLGLPDWFSPQTLENFSRWTKGDVADSFALMVNQLREAHSSIHLYTLGPERGPRGLLTLPLRSETQVYENYLDHQGPVRKQDFLSVHPTTLLTIRNVRSALREQGYQFPKAHLRGADIQVSPDQAEWFQDLEDYMRNRLGRVEAEGSDRRSVGRLRSLFRQRLVSSVQAARDSLENRQHALRALVETGDTDNLLDTWGKEFDPTSNDDVDAIPNIVFRESRIKRMKELAKNESYHIGRLLNRLNLLFAQEDTIVDPKMDRLKELVLEHLHAGRKVLVFSRFTSTTSAVVHEFSDLIEAFGVGRFDGEHVGVLKLVDQGVSLETCSRKQIMESLKTGRIRVLVCSDAASEGLNLHAANVAINVDVPWNPSRVLQRFGRVDRLGQKAKEVYLVNMYYPDSIEHRMYTALEDRRVNFMAVLGEVPDIISEQQRRMMDNLSGDAVGVGLTFQEIENARRTYARNQYDHLVLKDVGTYPALPLQVKMLETLKADPGHRPFNVVDPYTIEIDGTRVSVDPLDDDYLSLSSDKWQSFRTQPRDQRRTLQVLTIEDVEGRPLALVLRDGSSLLPVPTKAWPELFAFLFRGERVSILDLPRFATEQLGEALEYIRNQDQWIWPDHSELTTISKVPSTMPSLKNIQLGSPLGIVPVIGFAVPQADDITKVQQVPILVGEGYDTKEKMAKALGFHTRQSEYYTEAAGFLGLVTRSGGKYKLTGAGREFNALPSETRDSRMALLIESLPLIRFLLDELASRSAGGLTKEDIAKVISDNSHLTGSTVPRRAQTILSWFRFLETQTGKVSVRADTVIPLHEAKRN